LQLPTEHLHLAPTKGNQEDSSEEAKMEKNTNHDITKWASETLL